MGTVAQKDTRELSDRKPPSDQGSEMALVGSILLAPTLCDDIALAVREGDFYHHVPRTMFDHAMRLWKEGKHVDEVTIAASIQKTSPELFDEIGGNMALMDAAERCVNPAHALGYAETIRNTAMLRAVIQLGHSLIKDGYSGDDPTEAVGRAETGLFNLLERQAGQQSSSMFDLLLDLQEEFDARKGGKINGIRTGFPDIDQLTNGLFKQEMVILAARPSMGKSALAANIAENVASQCPVLFVSLEMSRLELVERILCSHAKVDTHNARSGHLSEDNHRNLAESSGRLSTLKLEVDDAPNRTVTEIVAQARRVKRKLGALGLVVIDYLQLIKPENPRDQREQQVALIARRLKAMARELDVPVLCLAQLNRQTETMKDNRPRLSHLRESGAIEQDADQVWFVHRDDYYRSRSEQDGSAEVIVAKDRNGRTGAVQLLWRPEWVRFVTKAQHGFDPYEGLDE